LDKTFKLTKILTLYEYNDKRGLFYFNKNKNKLEKEIENLNSEILKNKLNHNLTTINEIEKEE